MKKKTIAYSFLPLILFCLFNNLFGQDSLRLDEIVITATKTERSLSKIPLPVTSISAKEIHALGSSRLQDVLLEQVGINIVPQINGLGNGLQLQGLNPDYTLILIDGEPVVGKYTGSLEASFSNSIIGTTTLSIIEPLISSFNRIFLCFNIEIYADIIKCYRLLGD
ncbi:MAG TPA: Plug domain-containing protein, partial [Saprospiraceae bacterium]|nr:Plug domain-containing protein [Saprospiraceae bacterium]